MKNPSKTDLAESLSSWAYYLEECRENSIWQRMVMQNGIARDDQPEAVFFRVFCDPRFEGTDEAGDIIKLMRQAAEALNGN